MPNDLVRAVAILNTQLRHQLDVQLRPLGLSEVNYYYLLMVGAHPGINQAELTVVIGRDQSSVTRQVDRLTKQGWLRREKSPTDARQSALYLTDRAAELVPKLQEITDGVNEQFLSQLAPAEQNQLIEWLLKLG